MKEFQISVDKKCFWCLTDLIQNALCSPDLGEGFTYAEYVSKLSRKFSRDTQSQKFPPKKRRIYSQKANFAPEYSTFLGEFLTLGVSRKFSKRFGNMCWVCRTFS